MTVEYFEKAFREGMEKGLPMMDQDSSGQWFVAKKSANGIEFEIMEDEKAARTELAKLLFNPSSNKKTK